MNTTVAVVPQQHYSFVQSSPHYFPYSQYYITNDQQVALPQTSQQQQPLQQQQTQTNTQTFCRSYNNNNSQPLTPLVIAPFLSTSSFTSSSSSTSTSVYTFNNNNNNNNLISPTNSPYMAIPSSVAANSLALGRPRTKVGCKNSACGMLSKDRINLLLKIIKEKNKVSSIDHSITIVLSIEEILALILEELHRRGVVLANYGVRLVGSTASAIINSRQTTAEQSSAFYNDIDLSLYITRHSDFATLLDIEETIIVAEVRRQTGRELTKKDVFDQFFRERVKVNNREHDADKDTDNWSLITIGHEKERLIDIKFVKKIQRPYAFSIDSFHIILDPLVKDYMSLLPSCEKKDTVIESMDLIDTSSSPIPIIMTPSLSASSSEAVSPSTSPAPSTSSSSSSSPRTNGGFPFVNINASSFEREEETPVSSPTSPLPSPSPWSAVSQVWSSMPTSAANTSSRDQQLQSRDDLDFPPLIPVHSCKPATSLHCDLSKLESALSPRDPPTPTKPPALTITNSLTPPAAGTPGANTNNNPLYRVQVFSVYGNFHKAKQDLENNLLVTKDPHLIRRGIFRYCAEMAKGRISSNPSLFNEVFRESFFTQDKMKPAEFEKTLLKYVIKHRAEAKSFLKHLESILIQPYTPSPSSSVTGTPTSSPQLHGISTSSSSSPVSRPPSPQVIFDLEDNNSSVVNNIVNNNNANNNISSNSETKFDVYYFDYLNIIANIRQSLHCDDKFDQLCSSKLQHDGTSMSMFPNNNNKQGC
ncbi:hypothetical protein SAMD00019534_052200 [Acytostelium subglobosum LB1]|uniref:hypothetical protein n=1 Tax=Acytostelium subglobosum LB1 TaxID=1410327 RepID=UPI000644ED70|nr:hypothetical protein SAMD00019534_052200 [Acytostelium subglobosum LB1]GAM22045.1 hypothetical protein SAMD00019534_052200 [Acytostelium subglobosum LB1]|eukprot:XP_012755145.1 hypothetical protein SAMD00019534_052200 [Acytostelium subglobosum LB1]